MTLNLKYPMISFFGFFYKLTPQLIKFNTLKHDWITLPALGGSGVFLVHIQSHYKSVKFSFWVSVVFKRYLIIEYNVVAPFVASFKIRKFTSMEESQNLKMILFLHVRQTCKVVSCRGYLLFVSCIGVKVCVYNLYTAAYLEF